MNLLTLCMYCIFQSLVLLIVANGAPVITDKVLGKRLTKPIDHGLNLRDGYRLFGNSKTWRGLFSSICFTAMAAVFLGLEAITGVLFATLTMLGDLLASFIKRRLGSIESSRARGLDTVPESLLPLSFLYAPLGLSLFDIIMVAGLFFLIEEFVSPILYKLHIRNQPY
jgi:CDP-diglyceride synthetase